MSVDNATRPDLTLGAAAFDAALCELLLALGVGFTVPGPVPPLQHSGTETLPDLMRRAEEAQLLTDRGRLAPEVSDAVLATGDPFEVRRLQMALLEVHLEHRIPLGPLARSLASDGLRDARLADILQREGSAALSQDPVQALELLDLAIAAGADRRRLAPCRAEAAAAQGELDLACRILDDFYTPSGDAEFAEPSVGADLPGLRRAVRVSAAVWAQRGMMSRGADTHRWLTTRHPGAHDPLGTVALLASGNAPQVVAPAGNTAAAPALVDVSATLLVEGLVASLDASPQRALPMLIRASDTLTASGRLLPSPELPAAVAAQVAMLAGTPGTARTITAAALQGNQGGGNARPHLCLLAAWAAMLQDDYDAATGLVAEARSLVPDLVPRDELLVQALEVGLARRAGDTTALVLAWQRATEVLLHVSMDLFSLLPLGELMVAAARLRTPDVLQPHVDEAWALLHRLGDPVLWSVPLRWSAVQAELLLERPALLAPHAAELVRQAGTYALASTFAAAGKSWVSVLGGTVDPDAVEETARNLAAAGHAWDGARLAGHAAPRAGDRRDMTRLLACARELRPTPARTTTAAQPAPEVSARAPGGPVQPVPDAGRPSSGAQESAAHPARRPGSAEHEQHRQHRQHRSVGSEAAATTAVLTEREREIAHYVVQGRTYREISEAVFISPRTVEHHVARIRRRLGVASRSDLLANLRILVAEPRGNTP